MMDIEAVTRARHLQDRKPLPARAILARLHVAQANVAYVAGCSQGNVSNMLANRAPLSQAVKDAIVLLVDGAATRDELFKVES